MTSGYIFTLAGSLRTQVLCSLKFTKCPTGTFWLKLVAIARRIAPEGWEENPPDPPLMAAPDGGAGGGGGAGGAPPVEPAKPPTEAPETLQPHLDFLTKPLALILVAKQIPWVVQAKLAQEGYVTVEDLGDRWNTRRTHGPKGFGAWSSGTGRTTLMKPPPGSLPCACYRRSGPPSPWPRHRHSQRPLDSLCDRRVLETAYC